MLFCLVCSWVFCLFVVVFLCACVFVFCCLFCLFVFCYFLEGVGGFCFVLLRVFSHKHIFQMV